MAGPGAEVVVVSPHLDDGVLSLGASIATWSAAGARVRVVTVFAGDEADQRPAGFWDRKAGFATAAEAAAERRREDAAACAIVGAEPVWLPNADDQYGQPHCEEAIWSGLAGLLEDADVILAPGHPLAHVDHLWLTRLLIARLPADSQIRFYAEQPYATWRRLHRGPRLVRRLYGAIARWRLPGAGPLLAPSSRSPVDGAGLGRLKWHVLPVSAAALDAKRRAIGAYGTQIDLLGGQDTLDRMALYESRLGGEGIGVLRRSRTTERLAHGAALPAGLHGLLLRAALG